MGDFAVAESDHGGQGELHLAAGGRYAGQHPVHGQRMREAHDELLDQALAAEHLRQATKLEVGRDAGQELAGIEVADLGPPRPARSRWNAEHVGVLDHGREGCVGILEHELGVCVLLPDGRQALPGECDVVHDKVSLCSSLVGIAEQKLAGAYVVPLVDRRVLCRDVHVAQPPLQRRGLVDRAGPGQREARIDDAHAGRGDPDTGLGRPRASRPRSAFRRGRGASGFRPGSAERLGRPGAGGNATELVLEALRLAHRYRGL